MGFTTPLFGAGGSSQLLVDEDSITGVVEKKGMMLWTTRRSVRRGKVRSIFEIPAMFGNPGGVGVSERSQFGACMFGFVMLRKSMPEYDHLRELVESWRVTDTVN